MTVCDYWNKCKLGINENECQITICERRNDLPDMFELKKKGTESD